VGVLAARTSAPAAFAALAVVFGIAAALLAKARPEKRPDPATFVASIERPPRLLSTWRL
jgi:hypothetical protein